MNWSQRVVVCHPLDKPERRSFLPCAMAWRRRCSSKLASAESGMAFFALRREANGTPAIVLVPLGQARSGMVYRVYWLKRLQDWSWALVMCISCSVLLRFCHQNVKSIENKAGALGTRLVVQLCVAGAEIRGRKRNVQPAHLGAGERATPAGWHAGADRLLVRMLPVCDARVCLLTPLGKPQKGCHSVGGCSGLPKPPRTPCFP